MAQKPTAAEAFELNMADADELLRLVRVLADTRKNRMRLEHREAVSQVLGISRRDRDRLDRFESDDIYGVIKPGACIERKDLTEEALRPVLRQALVAACAAVETFVADRVMERWSGAVNAETIPGRLLELPMTVGDWLRIESRYERKKWGLRELAEIEIRNRASPSPSQIGQLFSVVGEKNLWRRVDSHRGSARGLSEHTLDRIYARRNKIAHEGDRVGRGRAHISRDEVQQDLVAIRDVIAGLESITRG